MNIQRYLLVQLLACLIITNYSIGQSTLTVAEGGKLKITPGTTVQNQNLDISNGSQLANRGDLTVNGILANNAGTSGLIVKADENGSGSLIHNSNDVPATVEQYLTSERWHLVSPPTANSTIEIYMDIYLKQWNEQDSTWSYMIQPTSTLMNASEGYSAWASDDLTGTTTVEYKGNLNNGNQLVNMSYTPTSNATGYNLIGNPYPSPIEWNADTSWNRINVAGWAVVYDNATYKGWNPFLTGIDRSYNGKTDGIIPATQGFWVRATASSANLTIPQCQRTHNNQVFYKDLEVSDYMSLRLKVEANNYNDEITIIFKEGASLDFDGLYDLEKMYNIDEAPNIYSKTGDKLYSVNVLPIDFIAEIDPPVIPLGYQLGIDGVNTLSVTGIESFDPKVPIYLEDMLENEMVDLRSQNTYAFSSSPTDNKNRFLLHFGDPNSIDNEVYSEVSIYSFENVVYVKVPINFYGHAEVFDLVGKKISSFKVDQVITRAAINKNTGYYIVKVKSSEEMVTQKVLIKN